MVGGIFLAAESTRSTSNLGKRTTREPVSTPKVRYRVMPKAWNIGSTAYMTSLPSATPCIHARPCSAFARRFRWVSIAPLGCPVVPEVYWMAARSVASGRGKSCFSGLDSSSFCHGIVFFTGAVNALRDFLAAGMGSRRASRLARGMARVRSTETIVLTARSAGNAWTLATTLSQTTATVAPWSSNWCRSSRSVYSGLCSTTTAPSRSTA